jgi:hypothetical protein
MQDNEALQNRKVKMNTRIEVAYAQPTEFAVQTRNPFDNADGRHTGKFFEEYFSGTACLGISIVEYSKTNRPLGVAGRRDFVLRSPITLMRGSGKIVTLFASPENPVRVWTMLQKLEGRRD